jgi:hypothetical protein
MDWAYCRHHHPMSSAAKHKVPALVVPAKGATAGVVSSERAGGSQTAPAALVLPTNDKGQGRDVPHRCPACDSRDIARWRQWFEHGGEWVWHCHHLSSSRSRKPRPFCGHMWRASRPIARCAQCGLALAIEEHSAVLGYWCGFCQDFSQ